MSVLVDLLKTARQVQASDLHVSSDCLPRLRVGGRLYSLTELEIQIGEHLLRGLPAQLVEDMAHGIMGQKQRVELREEGETDFAFQLEGLGRFRVNAFKQYKGLALAIRLLKEKIPKIETLGIPQHFVELARKSKGLLLVTGPTGSGKTTTLAAIVDYINQSLAGHIVTLEDPIEYLHTHKKCFVHQREVGVNSNNYQTALRAALRQDPDVIQVGEMRDPETMAIAITAAETGHLVLATLHTPSAAEAVDRIIDVFQPHQQQQIRAQLSLVLQGVLAQQLIHRIDCKGRMLLAELLIATPAVRSLIREGKTHQLANQMQTGAAYGMRTYDKAVKELLHSGLISQEELHRRRDYLLSPQ